MADANRNKDLSYPSLYQQSESDNLNTKNDCDDVLLLGKELGEREGVGKGRKGGWDL